MALRVATTFQSGPLVLVRKRISHASSAASLYLRQSATRQQGLIGFGIWDHSRCKIIAFRSGK